MTETIATARIELLDADPPIWREVEVPVGITLKVLHDIVQAVLGWQDSHLWEFTIARRRYGPRMRDVWGMDETADAAKTCLADVLRPRRTVIDYIYDFGDSWEHRIVLTRVRPAEEGAMYPRYVAGSGGAPPEDCGGLPGFYELLDAKADAKHPSHDEAEEWLGDYDPQAIDTARIARKLARIAKRRAGARTRRIPKVE